MEIDFAGWEHQPIGHPEVIEVSARLASPHTGSRHVVELVDAVIERIPTDVARLATAWRDERTLRLRFEMVADYASTARAFAALAEHLAAVEGPTPR